MVVVEERRKLSQKFFWKEKKVKMIRNRFKAKNNRKVWKIMILSLVKNTRVQLLSIRREHLNRSFQMERVKNHRNQNYKHLQKKINKKKHNTKRTMMRKISVNSQLKFKKKDCLQLKSLIEKSCSMIKTNLSGLLLLKKNILKKPVLLYIVGKLLLK